VKRSEAPEMGKSARVSNGVAPNRGAVDGQALGAGAEAAMVTSAERIVTCGSISCA
jgi:hypothetical protein